MSDSPYILTNSEMQSFLHCKRCWFLGYYRNLRRVGENKSILNVGTFVHKGLESYYSGQGDPIDWIRIKAVATIEEYPDHAAQIAKDAELAGIMLEGYMEEVASSGMDADLEVYAAEEMLEVPIGRFILRGKLDARAYRRSDGRRLFLEHKTVANLKDLVKTAQTNPQFLTYELLELLDLQSKGEDIERADGVLLNMLRKVKRTARANPPFYGREEVHFNQNELREHFKHVVGIGTEIERTRARLDAGEDLAYVCPPTNTRDCFWKDSFSQLCMSGIMDNGSDWEGYIQDVYEVWNPLERYDDDDVLEGV